MKLRLPAILSVLAVILLVLGLGLFLSSRPDAERVAEAAPAATASSPSLGATAPPHLADQKSLQVGEPENTVAPRQFSMKTNGRDRSYVLSLTEAVERLPEGKDRPLILDPPATPETLAKRLQEASSGSPVWPVCYEEGHAQTEFNRLIITNDLTLELAALGELPNLPAEIKLTDQPEFAPGYVVVSARDAFAAIAALEDLQSDPSIKLAQVQLARQQQRKTLPNDPLMSDQWHLKASGTATTTSDINVEEVWGYGSTGGVRGSGVVIAIVDDGMQTSHPDLAANVNTAIDRDWNGNDLNPDPGQGDNHGTACAGNAAAVGNNSRGVTGAAPESTLVGLRLIAAATTDSQEAQAAAHRSDIIDISSNSWGPWDGVTTPVGPGPLTQAAIANAAATGRDGKGTIFLWAGGNGRENNDNSNYDGYSNDIHTIGVGASNSFAKQSYYSESGANLVISGPSNGRNSSLGITTTDLVGSAGYQNGDYTNDFGGTSSATPTVAGIVALMLDTNPDLGWRDVQEILIASAQKNDPSDNDWRTNGAGFHFNHRFGAGIADASAAVALAANWTNLASASSDTASNNTIFSTIPDNNAAGVTQTLTLEGENLRCEQVTLTVDISHPNRGHLDITLISPDGTESRLAENHPLTDQDREQRDYDNWTFSTVRHWGEESNGVWTVKVADRRAGSIGSLTSLSLTAHGAPATIPNLGPVVTIDSPTSNTAFSPGSSVAVSVSASDELADGSPGTVTSVELFQNGLSQGVLTSAPYDFTLNPAIGLHTLTAVAINGDAETTTSRAVRITVGNQAPTINTASLSPAGQSYSDEPITVIGLSGNDPENAALSYSYLWEKSTDGVTWSDSGLTGDILSASPSHAGTLWRCRIIASDGVNSSAPFLTPVTNSLTRPPRAVTFNEQVAYRSGLVLRGEEAQFTRDVFINEFTHGIFGSDEYVELIVLRDTSLRGWSLSDTSASTLTFQDLPIWDNLRAGTVIVVYNGGARYGLLPADDFDASDHTLIIPSNNSAYFTGVWPNYFNSGDSVRLRDKAGALVAGFSFGNDNSIPPNLGSVGNRVAAYFRWGNESLANNANSWVTTSARTARGGGITRLPSSLPVIFGGSWDALPTGLTGSGLGTYSGSLGSDPSAGSAKFDESGDSLTIEFDESAAVLTYRLKGDAAGANTSGTFIVEESANGGSYTPIRTLTNLATSDTAYVETVAPATRFIRFRYASKGAGDIQLDQLVVSADQGLLGSLSLSVEPAIFSEAAGPSAATATLTLDSAAATDLTVNLSSSDPTAATLPATVVIPAGQVVTTITIAAVNDSVANDATQFATINAQSPGYRTASYELTVYDDEASSEGSTPGTGNTVANLELINDLRNGALDSPSLFRLTAASTLPSGLTFNSSLGLISGTVSPAATVRSYPITIERFNGFGEVVSQSFVLEVGESYQSWIAGEGVTAEGFNDDPDGDGVSNLLEYYLNGQANNSDPQILPTLISADDNTIVVTFWHLKTAVEVQGIIEWSDTLEANSWSTAGVTVEVLTDEPTRELLQATILSDDEPSRFVRLRVE